MRISDWSSDVCSSDLWPATLGGPRHSATGPLGVLYSANNRSGSRSNTVGGRFCAPDVAKAAPSASGDKTEVRCIDGLAGETDRKRVVLGKSVSGRVDIGGRRFI